MGTDFDPLDDIFADEVGKTAKTVGKFQPKAKFRPTKQGSASTSIHTSQIKQTVDSTHNKFVVIGSDVAPHNNGGCHASMDKSTGVNPDVFIGLDALGDFLPPTSTDREAVAFNAADPHSSVEHTSKGASIPTHTDLLQDTYSFTAGEPINPSSDVCYPLQNRALDREDMDLTDSLNMTKLATQSEKDLAVAFQHDDILDFSSLDFTRTSPDEPTLELPLNEQYVNLMETVNLDSGIRTEFVPEIPSKLASRRAKTGSCSAHITPDPPSQQPEGSPISPNNKTGRSLRSRKDKVADESLNSRQLSEVSLASPPMEDGNNDEEFQAESESKMEKSQSKSRKTTVDKEKPVRKRKAKEASDQDAGAKPKKFSHSTRRKRVVDKVLLETPEDEIDYQKVPLRDLIARAEHQEKQMKKNEVAGQAPGAKQSNGSSSGRSLEEQTFISMQDGEYNDEQGDALPEDTTLFFNYQTYMDKTPRTRWSKQDTELFYGAVRQFGTDLSMIEQLFPSRTRRQLKLKYKNEERHHPLRLRDALTNRTKDYSHFQKVIEHLNKIAAEEKQNAAADQDDSIDLTGNEGEDDVTTNANDERPNGEHTREEGTRDVAHGFVEAQSPLRSDGGEDDLFLWSQYKSS